MTNDRERLFFRLSTLPGIRPMPSIGDWILIEADDPRDLARDLNRRMPGGGEPVAHVPALVPDAVRVQVRDPKSNDELVRVLGEMCTERARAAAC